MGENLAALREDRIEAAQFFEPIVEETLATGAGHLWHAASAQRHTTYTAFVTARDRLLRDFDPLLRMVRAIHRTQHWIDGNPAAQFSAAIASFFPAIDRGYPVPDAACLGGDPILPEEGFDRLHRGLFSSGFIRRPIGYRACVDNRLALQVAAE
jgi:NitT/TauT family transport system substrate-binding protein